MKYNTLQHIYIQRREREHLSYVGGKKDYPSEAKHDKEIVTENRFLSYIYNNV